MNKSIKRQAWVVVLIGFLAGVALALAQNKVAPSITFIIDDLGISMVTAGWLSSIFCLMGMVISIPSAFIMNKLGVKASGLLALGAAIVGSLIGVFTESVSVLFLSRIVEGFGVGLISIVGPSLIAMWFPVSRRGLPTGIWGSWQMVSQAIIFLVGGHLTVNYGWRGVWWFVLGVCVFVAIMYAWKVTSPPPERNHADVESGTIPFRKGFRTLSTWLLSIAGIMFCFSCFGFATWIAPYWSEAFGWDINDANHWVSRLYTIEIAMVVFMGWVLDRIGKKRKVLSIISYALYTVILFISFRMQNPSFILLFVIAYALLEGAIPTALWTLCPQTVKEPALAGLGFGILSVGMNLGSVLGPPAVGAMVEAHGWAAGGTLIAASSLIGMVAMSMVKIHIPVQDPVKDPS